MRDELDQKSKCLDLGYKSDVCVGSNFHLDSCLSEWRNIWTFPRWYGPSHVDWAIAIEAGSMQIQSSVLSPRPHTCTAIPKAGTLSPVSGGGADQEAYRGVRGYKSSRMDLLGLVLAKKGRENRENKKKNREAEEKVDRIWHTPLHYTLPTPTSPALLPYLL